jgi:SAM-dependent methyltransferase
MNAREYQVMFEAEDRHWWYRTLHELVLRYIAAEHRRKGPLDMVDAGCGTGGLLARLAPFGRAIGFDASPLAVDFCRRRGLEQVRVADLGAAPIGEASCDVITCMDVLYHRNVPDEQAVLAALFAALRPGGLLIVDDPAFECLRGTHDEAVHGIRRFNRGPFQAALAGAGFRVEHITYRLSPLFLPIAAVRAVRRMRLGGKPAGDMPSDVAVPGRATNAVLLAIGRSDNAMITRAAMPFGTSLFSVARKPPTPSP